MQSATLFSTEEEEDKEKGGVGGVWIYTSIRLHCDAASADEKRCCPWLQQHVFVLRPPLSSSSQRFSKLFIDRERPVIAASIYSLSLSLFVWNVIKRSEDTLRVCWHTSQGKTDKSSCRSRHDGNIIKAMSSNVCNYEEAVQRNGSRFAPLPRFEVYKNVVSMATLEDRYYALDKRWRERTTRGSS